MSNLEILGAILIDSYREINIRGGIATVDFENAQIIRVNRGISYFGGAANESRVTASRVDNMALRILTPYYALK